MEPDWIYSTPFRRNPGLNGAVWIAVLGLIGAGIGLSARAFGLWM